MSSTSRRATITRTDLIDAPARVIPATRPRIDLRTTALGKLVRNAAAGQPATTQDLEAVPVMASEQADPATLRSALLRSLGRISQASGEGRYQDARDLGTHLMETYAASFGDDGPPPAIEHYDADELAANVREHRGY